MSEQRRLAAIVSADVAGYSRLMGRDESGTLAALKALRQEVIDPQIASHGGRIVKTTGDGLLLEFPSVVNAVRCAVEVQTAMADRAAGVAEDRRIAFRIGINIGDIIVDGDDIFGDGVNVAARLQEIAAPGGICISSRVHEDVRDRLNTAFDNGGTQTLKNIARPVQVWRWQPGTAEPPKPAPTPTALPLPDKPSIAVLPFQNMSGDPEQEYFADGVVEDIITALSSFKSLFVIARNSSFTYKGKAIDIKQVGRELGVRYVLEGSVRRSAGRVRISGQLIEAATSAHLWAEKIDGELSDVFELQDHITARVVSSIAPTIERAEIERLKQRPTNTTDSYDTYLRGMALVYQQRYAEARSLFKKAVEYDPEYAAAYAQSAFTYSLEQSFRGIMPTSKIRADALRDVDIALSITNDDALVLARCSHPLAYVCQQFDRAALLAERAVTLNSSLSTAWNLRGWISLMLAKPEQAIDSFEKVIRLSPLDPARPNALSGIAFGHFFLDYYDEGRRVAKEALQLFPNHQSFATYIVNCVGAGDLAEAKSAATQFLKFDPSFDVSRASAIFPMRSPEHREKFDNALRSAGVPD
jgi:TolB-like protein/class 3 adenylate cyclase